MSNQIVMSNRSAIRSIGVLAAIAVQFAGSVVAAEPRPADLAARRGLEYLRASQKPDGSWESGTFGRATSVTSLAVLAFLSAGHGPGVPGPYRTSIENGIRYVLSKQRPNGMLVSNASHGPMYCHGISTLMLAEVVGIAPDDELARACRVALGKAVGLILTAQTVPKTPEHAGGWRYQPNSRDSDLSVTGWQVVALRAAKSAGCGVPAESIDRAVEYLARCAVAAEDGGGFGYQPGQTPNSPRTGTGILALVLCGRPERPEVAAGAEYLLRHPPRWTNEYFFYEVYYCTQASFQLGDRVFSAYYPKLVAILLDHQDRDGSWLSGDPNDRTGGRVYCTAMAVLALAVEYRYLPIYQR